MPYTINRGQINFSLIDDLTPGKSVVKTSDINNLVDLALLLMNERDSIERIIANPTTTGQGQLTGIKDGTKEAELRGIKTRNLPTTIIHASDINILIKYINELVDTASSSAYETKDAPCTYVKKNVTIFHYVVDPKPATVQAIDPITGELLFNADGTPVYTRALVNPVPDLDADGNYQYYTVTHAIKYKEGYVEDTTPDKVVDICSSPSTSCTNKEVLDSWERTDVSDGTHQVTICKNPVRPQLVFSPQVIKGVSHVTNVNIGDVILASTFNAIINNLKAIDKGLASYNIFTPGCNSCQLTCQVRCQLACQLACQSCYGGTCHNQNCGGFS